jgi:hypothetical protein
LRWGPSGCWRVCRKLPDRLRIRIFLEICKLRMRMLISQNPTDLYSCRPLFLSPKKKKKLRQVKVGTSTLWLHQRNCHSHCFYHYENSVQSRILPQGSDIEFLISRCGNRGSSSRPTVYTPFLIKNLHPHFVGYMAAYRNHGSNARAIAPMIYFDQAYTMPRDSPYYCVVTCVQC